ncbi:unnamed protein product [Caretta caretta]
MGLRRSQGLSFLQEGEYSVVFLQETHMDLTAKDIWRLDWGDRVYFSHLTVCTAGVATLFSPDLRPEVLWVAKAVPGRLLHLRVCMEGLMVNLINVYAPTSILEQLPFYQQASAFLGTLHPHECLVLGGDFNITLEERDRSGTEQSPDAADVLRETVEHHTLVDIWQGQQHVFPSARRWWDLGKVCARLFCCEYTGGTSPQRDAAIEQLEREVLELERRLATSPEDPPLCRACREKREELRALEDHWPRGAFVQSCIRLLWEMDHGSHFFYALEKRRGAKKYVSCLLAEEGTPSRIRWRCAGGQEPSTQAFSPWIQPILMLAECSGRNSLWSMRATETSYSYLSVWPSSRKPSIACPPINLWS